VLAADATACCMVLQGACQAPQPAAELLPFAEGKTNIFPAALPAAPFHLLVGARSLGMALQS